MNTDTMAQPVEAKAIGEAQLKKASEILQKYKDGKSQTDARIKETEDWWRLRHWEHIKTQKNPQFQATSSYLFNVIMNKHADAIQAYPMPNILPHEENDKQEAQKLSSIIPVILRRNKFESTYDDVVTRKLISGTGVYSVYWDGSQLGGLGDITIKAINPLNIYPEPGVNDIQDGQNLFVLELVDNEQLIAAYPELQDKLKAATKTIVPAEFKHEDTIDTSDKSTVVHWYYKKYQNNKRVLHYCKYVDVHVLYASENDTTPPMIEETDPVTGAVITVPTGESIAERGYYDHGMYPFVFTSLFRIADSPWGFGYVDIGKNPQERIDRLGNAIAINAIVGATRRYMQGNGSNINEEEFTDYTKPIVHVNGMLNDNSIKPIEEPVLPGNYVTVLESFINELREVSGATEASTGAVPSGVTAASAIAALQQAAGKTSAASTMAEYRAYEQIVIMCIELIRQFYNVSRTFRITGRMGEEHYIQYNNANLQAQQIVDGFGTGYRAPEFDVEVSAETNSVYTRISQNEMALQLYNAGVFLPQNADQALMLLDTMDFQGKDRLMHKISQQGTMYRQMVAYQQLALAMVQKYEPDKAEGLASAILQSGGIQQKPISTDMPTPEGGTENPEESPITRKARQQAAEAPMPTNS